MSPLRCDSVRYSPPSTLALIWIDQCHAEEVGGGEGGGRGGTASQETAHWVRAAAAEIKIHGDTAGAAGLSPLRVKPSRAYLLKADGAQHLLVVLWIGLFVGQLHKALRQDTALVVFRLGNGLERGGGAVSDKINAISL